MVSLHAACNFIRLNILITAGAGAAGAAAVATLCRSRRGQG